MPTQKNPRSIEKYNPPHRDFFGANKTTSELNSDPGSYRGKFLERVLGPGVKFLWYEDVLRWHSNQTQQCNETNVINSSTTVCLCRLNFTKAVKARRALSRCITMCCHLLLLKTCPAESSSSFWSPANHVLVIWHHPNTANYNATPHSESAPILI